MVAQGVLLKSIALAPMQASVGGWGLQRPEGEGGERVCGGWQRPAGTPSSVGRERAAWPVAKGSGDGPAAAAPPPCGLQASAGGVLSRGGGGSPGRGGPAGRPLGV